MPPKQITYESERFYYRFEGCNKDFTSQFSLSRHQTAKKHHATDKLQSAKATKLQSTKQAKPKSKNAAKKSTNEANSKSKKEPSINLGHAMSGNENFLCTLHFLLIYHLLCLRRVSFRKGQLWRGKNVNYYFVFFTQLFIINHK